jgi:hypothetical protein
MSVSEHVVLRLTLPGVVVAWFVTDSSCRCQNCIRDREGTCSFLNQPVVSCRLLVLADQPAKNPAMPYRRCRKIDSNGRGYLVSARRAQVLGPVRAMLGSLTVPARLGRQLSQLTGSCIAGTRLWRLTDEGSHH